MLMSDKRLQEIATACNTCISRCRGCVVAYGRKIATEAYRKAIEDAAAVCTEMIDNSDYGLDRERTVGLARHRINRILERIGQNLPEGE